LTFVFLSLYFLHGHHLGVLSRVSGSLPAATKAIWENRAEIAKQHPAGNAINEENAARYTGTPFHKGAIRYYKEIGIWPEDQPEAASVDEK
jgi:hypothetical protein